MEIYQLRIFAAVADTEGIAALFGYPRGKVDNPLLAATCAMLDDDRYCR